MLTEKQIERWAVENAGSGDLVSDLSKGWAKAGATWANGQNAAEIAQLKAENERLRKEYAQAGDKIADLEDRIYNLKIKFETLNERDSE